MYIHIIHVNVQCLVAYYPLFPVYYYISNGFLCRSKEYLGFVIAEFRPSCSTKLDSSVYTVECNGFKSHQGKRVFML